MSSRTVRQNGRRWLRSAVFLAGVLILLAAGIILSPAFAAGVAQYKDNVVGAGNWHTCGLLLNGDIDCWGANDHGQADDQIGPFRQISAGGEHTCGLRVDGRADCWGYNLNPYGQVTGQALDHDGPFTQVEVGAFHTCALKEDGSVECWGDNEWGQSNDQVGPYMEIDVGEYHSCGLRHVDGSADCWGGSVGTEGQDRAGPFTHLASGLYHNCGLTPGNDAFCWGVDESGWQTTEFTQSGPFEQLTAGMFFSCGLTPGGDIECWGMQDPSQIDVRSGPYVEINAGLDYVCGLLPDKRIECWYNANSAHSQFLAGPYGPYDLNTAPVAVADDYSTIAGQELSVIAPGVLDNDTDDDSDPLTAVWDSGPAHGLLTLNDDGSFLYTPDAGYVGSDSFTYMASDGTADSNVAMVSIDIDYVFAGFFPPVDNPPVVNGVKAGKAVPIKFSLGGNYGLDIVSASYPTVKRIPCVGESDIDNIEEAMTAGSSGLHYDAQTGQYTYVWKTAKRWAGTCRQFQLMLDDGTTHVADFVFK